MLLYWGEEKKVYENIHSPLRYPSPGLQTLGLSWPLQHVPRWLSWQALTCHFSRDSQRFLWLLRWLDCFPSFPRRRRKRRDPRGISHPCWQVSLPHYAQHIWHCCGGEEVPEAWSHQRGWWSSWIWALPPGCSPGSFSPSAGRRWGRREDSMYSLPCHHLLPRPAGSSFAGESIKVTTCRKDLLGKPVCSEPGELPAKTLHKYRRKSQEIYLFFNFKINLLVFFLNSSLLTGGTDARNYKQAWKESATDKITSLKSRYMPESELRITHCIWLLC